MTTGAAVLTVTDSGPGIPEQDRERVFDRFYRLEDSSSDGSGLGLAIVKNIVERHHGEICLESGAEGRGLRAVVRLPLSRSCAERIEN